MKKQIFILLLFSAILMQCREELPVSEDFPIVFTTKAMPHDQGFRFEGELIDDSGYEILMHGFMYAPAGRDRGPGAIVYELGYPSDKTFTLNTTSIGQAPSYEYQAFVTYMDNSTKKTSYGNVLHFNSKAAGHYQPVWNLRAANESLTGTGEGVAVVSRGAYIIQQDGKITSFNGISLTSGAADFPLNANQPDVTLYCAMPFILNSKNNNLYRLQENNSWAIITQLPFDPEKLATGDVYINVYYPHIYIFGSFGTHLYNYRDNIWETGTTLPLSSGVAIVTGTNYYGGYYILTTDGKIQEFNGSFPPRLITTFPGAIEGQAHMFFLVDFLFLYVHSGQKMWEFNVGLAEWNEVAPFPEELNHPLYFFSDEGLYIANKKANGNYDIWQFSQFE